MACGVSMAYGVCQSRPRKVEWCSKSNRKLSEEGSEQRKCAICLVVCFFPLFFFVTRIIIDYVQNNPFFFNSKGMGEKGRGRD